MFALIRPCLAVPCLVLGNYGRSLSYRTGKTVTGENLEPPLRTEKVRIVFEIHDADFWDLFVERMTSVRQK